jgi:hypothetical protein
MSSEEDVAVTYVWKPLNKELLFPSKEGKRKALRQMKESTEWCSG